MRKPISLNWALGDMIESNGEFFIFNALALYMDNSNIVYHKIADMCIKAKCGPKAFKRHLDSLVEQGFVLPVGNAYMINPEYAFKVESKEDIADLKELYVRNQNGVL